MTRNSHSSDYFESLGAAKDITATGYEFKGMMETMLMIVQGVEKRSKKKSRLLGRDSLSTKQQNNKGGSAK
jgi:hypothetical protein